MCMCVCACVFVYVNVCISLYVSMFQRLSLILVVAKAVLLARGEGEECTFEATLEQNERKPITSSTFMTCEVRPHEHTP